MSPVGLVIMTLGRARAHWTELLADYDPAQVEPEWSQSRARVEPIRARFYFANLIFPPAPRPLGHKRGCSVENNSACSL